MNFYYLVQKLSFGVLWRFLRKRLSSIREMMEELDKEFEIDVDILFLLWIVCSIYYKQFY